MFSPLFFLINDAAAQFVMLFFKNGEKYNGSVIISMFVLVY